MRIISRINKFPGVSAIFLASLMAMAMPAQAGSFGYDFNTLSGSDTYPFTNLDGQDGWTSEGYPSNAFIMGVTSTLGFDGTPALRFQDVGSGYGVDASHLRSPTFLLPQVNPYVANMVLEGDFGVGYWGNSLRLAADVSTVDGQIRKTDPSEIGPGLNIGSNDTVVGLRLIDATGGVTSVTLASLGIQNGDWVRLRLAIDFDGAGTGSVYYQNLSNGDPSMQPVGALQNIPMGFNLAANDASNPGLWDALFIHLEGATNQLDNISVETAESSFATFHVSKDFEPANDAEVEVFSSCNDGLPLNNNATITENSDGVTFIVEHYTDGNLECEITEGPVADGYNDSYVASIVNGGADELGNVDGCQFTGVVGGDFACEITNRGQNATFTVTKTWEVINEGGDLVPQVADILIRCERKIRSASPGADTGFDGLFTARKKLMGDDELWVEVATDTKFGPGRCNGIELVARHDSAVEQSTTCSSTPKPSASWTKLGPGESGGCSFTNTVFFDGIPALNRYGLALLALLMLGVGAVGFRRFS